jgi:hypothetical protein
MVSNDSLLFGYMMEKKALEKYSYTYFLFVSFKQLRSLVFFPNVFSPLKHK